MSHYNGQVPDTEPARKWLVDAACAGPDYEGRRDLWFPTPGDQLTRAEAVAVCQTCPVRMACLTDALREERGRHDNSRHGIRGGLTGRQRRGLYERMRRRRRQTGSTGSTGTTKAAA